MRVKTFFQILLSLFILIQVSLNAQISIVSIGVQPFNIVPESMLNAGILNNEGEQQVQLITQVFGAGNTLLLTVKSQFFTLKKGLNMFSTDRKVLSSDYVSTTQGSYIKSTHSLPSGRYKVCSTLNSANGADKLDDFCEELEAEFNQYLYLVNPLDGDTVDTKTPILSWTHSEPFSILNQGEFYRMVVTEMKKGQSPEEAITVNSPVMVKNYLKEHQLQYPYDAKELRAGGKYAWQVQKLSDGVVINKTEAWSFNLRSNIGAKSLKYVALKSEMDGAYYTAYEGKVFFKFNEEYKSNGGLNFKLTDTKANPVNINLNQDKDQDRSKDKSSHLPAQLKYSGDNRYELDLDGKNLNSGFYTLEVKNEKKETFFLKIFLP
jgi:hypothetical protein